MHEIGFFDLLATCIQLESVGSVVNPLALHIMIAMFHYRRDSKCQTTQAYEVVNTYNCFP
jgi:hypothetical protein